MELTDTTRNDDNSLADAAANGLQAALYSGLQQPYDSVRQLAREVVHINLPEAQLASAPHSAKTGTASWFAETIGGAAGMIPWIIASHKMVRAGSSYAGLGRETHSLMSTIKVGEAGLTGATYSALFQPTQDNGNFLLNKTADAGIAFGTFAAGAKLSNTLRPMFGTYTSEIANRAVTVGTGSLSAFGAGVINAGASNLLGRPHQDPLQAGLKFAVAGGVFSAAMDSGTRSNSKGRSGEHETRVDAGELPGEMLGARVADAGTRVTDTGTRVTDSGTRVTDSGTRVTDSGTRVTDSGTAFAGSGTIFGASGFRLGDARVNAMSKNITPAGDPLITSPLMETAPGSLYTERSAGASKSRTSDMFGPRPEAVQQAIEQIRSSRGENSPELASAFVQLGDAHMVQGKLSNPQAQASYEQALQIFRSHGAETPQVAWVYDKLANVKHSSGDTIGAAQDLGRALGIWRNNNAASFNPATESLILRRSEDLAKLERLNQYLATSPLRPSDALP